MKYSSTALWTIGNKFTKRPFLTTLAVQRNDSSTHPLFKLTFVVPYLVVIQQSRETLIASKDMKYVWVLEGSQVISFIE